MINDFYDYIYFIHSNNIIEYSIEKFKELLEIEKKGINENHCYLLSKIRKIIISKI